MGKIEITIAEDARERLEQWLGRKLETAPLRRGIRQPQHSRPFLQPVIDEQMPAIKEQIEAAVKTATDKMLRKRSKRIGRILRGESR